MVDAAGADAEFAGAVEDAFLFALGAAEDDAERRNLLDEALPEYDPFLVNQLLESADYLLRDFLDGDAQQALLGAPMAALHTHLDGGDPALVGDGQCVHAKESRWTASKGRRSSLQRAFKS